MKTRICLKYFVNGRRHVIDGIEIFSDDSDDSDEEHIKDVKLMLLEKTIFENVFSEGAIWKMHFGCWSSQ